ncbi:quinone oxidoreductase [Agrobacterium sp. MOPV5]|uniref:quinone oxidoreductase family protein n=1 Tax=Agrobacterium leguminum TaxID=2792015 RepID=UPI0018C2E0CC|nr:quinone oxidoreductase [Agrobacterium leguminum]MBG0511027.1 quinone oxidoreductase [Agrobacterium leguminum]
MKQFETLVEDFVLVDIYQRAIVRQQGGPEVIEWEEFQAAPPLAGEVLIRQEAVGVEFIDTQLRSGQMSAQTPMGLGYSAVGTIETVGAGIDGLKMGDRVVYSWFNPGAYAEMRTVPAERVFRLPDQTIPADIAAGAIFRGLTAWYLATRLRKIEAGDFVLVHAVAGGVGQILVQWLKYLGAVIIGTAGSEEKLKLGKVLGVDFPILQENDFAKEVYEITKGKKCSVVYESIGKATFAGSLDSVARFGLLASFGWPSGDVGSVSLPEIRNKGSIFVTRPTVSQYTADAADFKAGASAVFEMIAKGALKINVGNTYPLLEAARAHTDLVGRRTTGSVVLTINR